MWKYLWFVMHIQQKKEEEMTGVEGYCYRLIKNDVFIKWLPLKVSKVLSSSSDKTDESNEETAESLIAKVRLALSLQLSFKTGNIDSAV